MNPTMENEPAMRTSPMKPLARRAALLGALSAALLTSACAPLLVGGAMVGTALMTTDRRTSGTQIEDQGIELKASTRLREQIGDRAHISVNSYNRMVLLTGEAPSEGDRAAAERVVAQIDNVSRVLNEIVVSGNSSLTSRSNDVLIASKVKASLVDARDLISNAFYVVVERGTVFIMGRVTEREATRASEIARGVGGVQKVVRAMEIISEEELARITPQAPAGK